MEGLIYENYDSLILVSCDDWSAVYVDGEMKYEGHSISDSEWLEIISSGSYKKVESFILDEEYVEENGFHQYFADFPSEVLE